jgi:hypothetical protein
LLPEIGRVLLECVPFHVEDEVENENHSQNQLCLKGYIPKLKQYIRK